MAKCLNECYGVEVSPGNSIIIRLNVANYTHGVEIEKYEHEIVLNVIKTDIDGKKIPREDFNIVIPIGETENKLTLSQIHTQLKNDAIWDTVKQGVIDALLEHADEIYEE